MINSENSQVIGYLVKLSPNGYRENIKESNPDD